MTSEHADSATMPDANSLGASDMTTRPASNVSQANRATAGSSTMSAQLLIVGPRGEKAANARRFSGTNSDEMISTAWPVVGSFHRCCTNNPTPNRTAVTAVKITNLRMGMASI